MLKGKQALTGYAEIAVRPNPIKIVIVTTAAIIANLRSLSMLHPTITTT